MSKIKKSAVDKACGVFRNSIVPTIAAAGGVLDETDRLALEYLRKELDEVLALDEMLKKVGAKAVWREREEG